jgi:hypothetical protein
VESQPYIRIQNSRLSKVVVWLRITVDEEQIAIVMGHLEPLKKICMKNTLLSRSVPFIFTITAILKNICMYSIMNNMIRPRKKKEENGNSGF